MADPLGLPRADELVDDALGRVVEVSKLRLPQDQGVGIGHGEAQLEPWKGKWRRRVDGGRGVTARRPTKHAVLGQGAVADGVGRLVGPQVVHGDTDSFVHLLVMENMMTVTWGKKKKNNKDLEIFL